MEKIQRRATRMMDDLRGMEYEERLRHTRLVTLEARRTRADIIEVFKIMKGLEGLNSEDFFEMEVDKRTRVHTLNILKRGARLDCRKYSFSQSRRTNDDQVISIHDMVNHDATYGTTSLSVTQ